MLRLAAAVLVAAALYGAKQEGVVDRAALLGSCTPVATANDESQWLACRRGFLTGYPDLRGDSCTYRDLRGELELWHCPAAVVTSRAAGAPAPSAAP